MPPRVLNSRKRKNTANAPAATAGAPGANKRTKTKRKTNKKNNQETPDACAHLLRGYSGDRGQFSSIEDRERVFFDAALSTQPGAQGPEPGKSPQTLAREILGWEKNDQAGMRCPRCKQQNVQYVLVQDRSADEPMSAYCRCRNPDCAHQWRKRG